MHRSAIFRRRIILGFAVVALLAVLISIVSIYALRSVIETKDTVISDYAQDLFNARALEFAAEQQVAASRAYLLTGNPLFHDRAREARGRFKEMLETLKRGPPEEEERRLLDRVTRAEETHRAALQEAYSAEKANEDSSAVAEVFEETVRPKREELVRAFATLVSRKEQVLNDALHRSRGAAGRATTLVILIGVTAVVLAGGLFLLCTRTLGRLGRAEAEIQEANESLERRVEQRTTELAKTVKELEGFAYTVAHDLRAPLRAMTGFSRALVEDCGEKLSDVELDYLRRVESAGSRMDEFIQDLLDYSRISYEPVKLSPTELSPLLREVVERSAADAGARGAEIRIDGPLPRVMGEEGLLRQCFENLVSNAIKFVAPGVVPKVRIRSEVRGPRVRLWVEDNGIGIAPEYYKRIFGVFQRLNRMEEYPGTGIGLALVQKAVERMGGAVGVASERSGGSRFWIELDAAPSAP